MPNITQFCILGSIIGFIAIISGILIIHRYYLTYIVLFVYVVLLSILQVVSTATIRGHSIPSGQMIYAWGIPVFLIFCASFAAIRFFMDRK